MRLRSHSFPKQAPAPQRDGRPALGRRCHAKALRWRFFPLSYDLIRAMNSRRRSGRDVHFMARPPPRSVRAAFPHTAPASGV